MGTYRLFPSTNGPSSPVSYSGPFLAGVYFCVTSNCWFEGYWWWVCPSGQSTSPQKFALWQVYGAGEGNVIPGSVVTSGTLTAGQWNYIPLATPLQLSIGNVPGTGAAVYEAATGFSNSFPDTNSQFGSGDPYASGITSGPLFGYSDQGASAPSPSSAGAFQGAFGVAGTDPSVNMPAQGSSSSNFWIDLQVSDTAPTGYSGSYRLWPSYPTVFPTQATIDTQAQTIGTQFSLSEPCTLDNVWFYSPPFAQDMPASTQIWNATTQTLVSGTNLTASWSRWPGQRVGGQFLRQRGHRAAGRELHRDHLLRRRQGVLHGVAGLLRFVPGQCRASHQRHHQWAAVVTVQLAHAFNPPGGNSCYHVGYRPRRTPTHGTTEDGGENRWVDVEVTPSAASSSPTPTPTSTSTSPVVTNSGAFLTFFP